uniref:Uncharacterized protein n=1 Tax=viral metagenome TaxID=1070528 RepID=A0A6M3LNC0_9ZZZZ
MPDETDGLNRQQYDEHKDKEQELLKQAWYEKAEKCPVRCGPRCNLSGEFCIMKNCFGEYWKKYDK